LARARQRAREDLRHIGGIDDSLARLAFVQLVGGTQSSIPDHGTAKVTRTSSCAIVNAAVHSSSMGTST
jgi:hypothetical protein